VNIGRTTTDDTNADEQELVPTGQDLILDPWAYERSPGTEVVQHLTTNLCFQANGVSLLKAGRKSFEFDGAHVSLNRAGAAQTFTVGNSIVRGISIDVPDAWLKRFALCDLVTGDGVGIRDPDLVFLARRIYEESVCGDAFSPMVVDALMVELLVSFVRRINVAKRVAPGWVQQIASAIRNDPSHPYKLEELSKLVGYHPVHIARTLESSLVRRLANLSGAPAWIWPGHFWPITVYQSQKSLKWPVSPTKAISTGYFDAASI